MFGQYFGAFFSRPHSVTLLTTVLASRVSLFKGPSSISVEPVFLSLFCVFFSQFFCLFFYLFFRLSFSVCFSVCLSAFFTSSSCAHSLGSLFHSQNFCHAIILIPVIVFVILISRQFILFTKYGPIFFGVNYVRKKCYVRGLGQKLIWSCCLKCLAA
jgi:hypothetical protein